MPALDPPRILRRPDGATIAYRARTGPGGAGLMFLGGFRSDMTGTKASALDAWATRNGRAYVRFDYFGHGESSGAFRKGTIGRWTNDALAVLDETTQGPLVLVGSSMGGWIALLVALARPERVRGLIGFAAAPDFTEDLMWARFSDDVRRTLEADGVYLEPSAYDPEPTAITRELIEEGRRHLLLRGPIALDIPVRLFHGMRDPDVPWQHSCRLAEALTGNDVTLTLIKSGDHRLSEPDDLDRLTRAVEELCKAAERSRG